MPRPISRASCSILSLTSLLILTLSVPTPAEILSGRVVNRTLSRPAPGCVVSLTRHATAEAPVERDTTDAEGAFQFDIPDAPAASDSAHTVLSAAYAGVDYRYPVDRESADPLEIPVYEITDVDTAVALVSHHIVIDANAGELTQILIFENSGDRTYRTGEGHGHGLEAYLPEGVTEILGGTEGLHTHGRLLIDPRPVRPGRGQLVFGLQLPPDRHLVQEVRYPTGSLDILTVPADIPVTGAALQDLGEVTFGHRSYRRYSTSALKTGDRIDVQIGPPPPDGRPSRAGLWGVLGALCIVMVFLAVFLRFRKKTKSPAKAGGSRSGGPPNQARRSALLREIADLDDRFAEGEISEADYRDRRDALKTELVQITRAIGPAGG